MAEPSLIYGVHAVAAALAHHPGDVGELWYDGGRRDPRVRDIVRRAEALGVVVHRVARPELEALLPRVRHQGVAARVRGAASVRPADLDQLLDGLDHAPLLLVLDGVQDPHNLGACLRSADAAGADAVVVPKDRAVGLTATVRKVASGAAETVPVIPVTNLARTLRALKGRGVWTVGLAGEAERDLYATELTGPLALVLGAEEKGLRRLTREHCDWLVRIPMRGAVESLNVSVAAGICLFEALRQRR